jgi:hypothetical protein
MVFQYSAGETHQFNTRGYMRDYGLYANVPSRNGVRFAAWRGIEAFHSAAFVLEFDIRFEQFSKQLQSEAFVKLLTTENDTFKSELKFGATWGEGIGLILLEFVSYDGQ